MRRMERYKLPMYYIQVPELPRNRMKKLVRKVLKRIIYLPKRETL